MEFVHALISGSTQYFNQFTFILMMIGIAVGLVVSILRRLGGPTAMALLLPLNYKVSAAGVLAFLLGATAFTATPGSSRPTPPY
jgi:TctA family transporter